MNYESELNEIFINKLCDIYSKKNKRMVFKIFILRFLTEYMDKESLTQWELEFFMPKFLLEELNLTIDKDNNLIYKNEKITVFSSDENSVRNILDDWIFRYGSYIQEDFFCEKQEKIEYIKKEWLAIKKKIRSRVKIKKNSKWFYDIYKHYIYTYIQKTYDINYSYPGILPDFKYNYICKYGIHEKYESIYYAYKFSHKGKAHILQEKELEMYLIRNLNILEDGMKYITHQLKVGQGIIDILAKDKNDIFCIIELKVENDIDILWQSLYYPEKIKEYLNVEKLRMIVLTYPLPKHILNPLKETNAEIYFFDYTSFDFRLKNLSIKKVF